MSQSGISRLFPIAGWLPDCTAKILRTDVVAGLAVAGLLIPEGMAYAGIAGVPPQMGLYAALAGMFVYAIFGSSRPLAVTPASSSAASPEIDVTSLETLERLRSELQEAGIDLYFARTSDGVRDLLGRSGFLERLGKGRILTGVDVAVDVFLKTSSLSKEQPVPLEQTHA